MKQLSLIGAVIIGLFAVAAVHAGEAVTLKGKGVCAHCNLGTAKSCAPVLAVEKDGETKHYYVKGAGAKKIRGKSAEVKGEVSTVDGKMIVTATEIKAYKKK